jgi:hypothetical protein
LEQMFGSAGQLAGENRQSEHVPLLGPALVPDWQE